MICPHCNVGFEEDWVFIEVKPHTCRICQSATTGAWVSTNYKGATVCDECFNSIQEVEGNGDARF